MTSVSSRADPIECSRSVILIPDISIDEAITSNYDVVVMPGGLKGAETFAASPDVGKLLQKQEAASKMIAAICAGN